MASKQDPYTKSVKADFDSDELLDRIEGDRELFKEVIRIFIDDTPGLISLLGDGIIKGDAEAVESAAHAIKGSCAMISAKKLERLTHQLEMMGRVRQLSNAQAAFQNVVRCFEDLKSMMIALLEKMDHSEP